jgi:DNA ligase 4
MPFKFRHLCDLLQSLDDNRIKKKATDARARSSDTPIIITWFRKHERQIPRHGTAAVAFLSCLFPERRADRVYNIQEKRLEKIVGRTLQLGTTRIARLSSWKAPNGADFAQTVQNVMSEAEFDRPRPDFEVTLEEIDSLFDRIAATYGGSSPELQTRIRNPITADEALQPLLRRLQSVEAKWLIRMFLKRYAPVELPERLAMRQFHCLLPDLLCLQNCFAAAMTCLDSPSFSHLASRPLDEEHEQKIKIEAEPYLKPQVGIMIQRASFYKARSIQHCCDMVGRRRISVERKYDGEYCQVHINISKDKKSIKIFSKSGKDSTEDRVRLHGAIENALKLGRKDCPIKKQCILEGELLIWHEKEQRIQPFEKIRKHVARNGRFLGNDQDSPRDHQERLMIMFYDLLLYDDILCLNESLEQRRSRLRSLVRRVPGQAELGYREKINFASTDAKSMIRLAFAKCISKGWEGFVLKGCDDPYFSLASSPRCIKLKKDYITGLGDMADLAVIGGRRVARDEHALNIGKLNWTTFHIACLENRDEVRRISEKPRFRIVGVVSAAKKTLSPDRTRLFNELGKFESLPYASIREEMDVIMDQRLDPPTELFKNPFVVEVVGGGFEKPANVTYHCLRFPRVSKFHEDRSCHEIMSFDELQELAAKANAIAANEDSQEDREWIERLVRADPKSKFLNENSANTTPRRNTGSVMTDGFTLSACHSSMTPLLVRMDTQEMTEQERSERDSVWRGNHSSFSLPQDKIGSSKRKRLMQQTSPTANMSTKRLRLPEHHTHTAIHNALDSQVSELSSGAPLSRMPLLEIENPSNATTVSCLGPQDSPYLPVDQRHRDQAHNHPPRSKEGLAFATSDLQARRSMVSPSEQTTANIPTKLPLLTPLKSSAEHVQNRKAYTVTGGTAQWSSPSMPKGSGKHENNEIAQPSELSRDNERQKLPRLENILARYSTMIFLPSANATTLSNDHNRWVTSFPNVEALFTFSRELFLGSIQKAFAALHIAIVNTSNTKETGHEVGTFYHDIAKQLRDGKIMGEGRLIFFDWEILQTLGSDELPITMAKPYFAGCLIWETGSDNARMRTWVLRDIWKWAEVMDLMNAI